MKRTCRNISDMNPKEVLLLDALYMKISEKAFSELDIYCLYILLREYTEEGGWLRELGDFVAHRERTQGILFSKFQNLHTFLYDASHDEKSYKDGFAAIKSFKLDDFLIEINNMLTKFNKPMLDESHVTEIMLYTFSLLQASTYTMNSISNEDGKKGHLFTMFSNEYVALMTNPSLNTVPFYCFAKLDIHVSVKDDVWWKKNWHVVFDALRKTPFSITRDSNNTPRICLNGQHI